MIWEATVTYNGDELDDLLGLRPIGTRVCSVDVGAVLGHLHEIWDAAMRAGEVTVNLKRRPFNHSERRLHAR